jgi:hypothetical protein
MGNTDKARGYFERIANELKGTVYEEKAKAWLAALLRSGLCGYNLVDDGSLALKRLTRLLRETGRVETR